MSRVRFPVCSLLVLVCCLLPAVALAFDIPVGTRLTIYGLFHQTPQGGILLSCPQEPDIVYLPFDPSAIMSDVFDIQVQVRGTLQATFQRDGKTVRVLSVTHITPLRSDYGETHVIDHAAFGLPGADAPQIRISHDATCYLYERYAVLERQAPGFNGHVLHILARNPGDDPAAECANFQGTPLFSIDHAADYTFAGLSGNTLLLQKGLPQQLHGLMAVNLAQARQTLDAVVVPGEAIAGDVLNYRQQAHAQCPTGQIAVRPMTLDFATGRIRDIGRPVCWH